MLRVAASVDTGIPGVLPLCFIAEDGSSTIILINSEAEVAMVSLSGLPAEMPDHPRKMFRSTLTEPFTEFSAVRFGDKLDLAPESITTLYSGSN